MKRAKELIDTCRQVICMLDVDAAGDFYYELKELYAYAKKFGNSHDSKILS